MKLDTLGQRITFAREAAGLTQEGLANKMNVEPETVSRWESDDFRPRAPKIRLLAEILEREPDWLIGHDEKPSKESFKQELRALSERFNQVEQQLNIHPAIRAIVEILATFNDDELARARTNIESIQRTSARGAANPSKKSHSSR